MCLDMSEICGMHFGLLEKAAETSTVGLLYTGMAAKAAGNRDVEEMSILDQQFRLHMI